MTQTVAAEELPPPPSTEAEKTLKVFVQVVINGRIAEGVVGLDTDESRLLVAAEDLTRAGLNVKETGVIDLAARFDIESRYDPLEQRLHLVVPAAMLPTTHLSATAATQATAEASNGMVLNYDLYVQRGGRITSASLLTEQRLFGRFGSLSNSGTFRLASGAAGNRNGYLRFDTRLRHVDARRALAITAGDLITGSLPWTSSVRLGGIQIGRTFAARPDLITTPLPSFAGEAAVPSAVDLFVNGYRQERADVAPGRFVLENMPVINGAGQARIVTTDAVGRQVATTIPFYVSSSLLRPGLIDFSAELGFLRRGYGLTSFQYGSAAASFVTRRGMTARLTLEGHGEARRGLVMGGVGAAWAPGLWGTLHATAAASQSGARAGRQWSVGYDFSAQTFAIALEHRERSAGYRDLGDFDLANLGSARSDRIVASASMAGWGSAGFSYIDVRPRSGERAQILSASWSLPFGRSISAFASADYDLRRRGASMQLRLVVPLGAASFSGGLDVDRDRELRIQAGFDRAVPSDGGWGLSAAAAADRSGNAFGQATVLARTPTAQFEAGASLAGRRAAGWASLRGALVAMDGGLFAANSAASSFAVVSTDGIAGVPVTYENQPIGTTNAKGRLFVPDVTAYHIGRFAIDPLALNTGLSPTLVETKIAVAERAGVVVRMPIRRTLSITAALVDPDGAPLPPGTLAERANGEMTPIGWDGVVFLTEVTGDLALTVRRGQRRCRAVISVPASTLPLSHLGAIPCE